MSERDFDQAKYWKSRHEKYAGDPRSVGNLAAPREGMEAAEAELRIVLSAALELCALKPGARVLDLGCGYGRVAPVFLNRGLDYTGIDVSPIAIDRARSENPSGKFEVADLDEWAERRSLDLVVALYIFVHFVNDEKWESIVERSIRCLKPSGCIVLADHFPSERISTTSHARARPIEEYRIFLSRHNCFLDEEFESKLLMQFSHQKSSARQFKLIRRAECR